jgi:hypothetical protein
MVLLKIVQFVRTDIDAEQVSLDLEEQVVDGHASPHLQRLELDARILIERVKDVTRLERDAFQHCSREMGFRYPFCQSNGHAV